MPITAFTFIIGWLAIAGIPPFSGFWSKDEVLLAAWNENKIAWVMLLAAAVMTAFYMSRLDWILKKIAVDNLIFAGIVTNGGVASTLRDAHVRDFNSILLSDGCAAFNLESHQIAVSSLAPVADICTCSQLLERLV